MGANQSSSTNHPVNHIQSSVNRPWSLPPRPTPQSLPVPAAARTKPTMPPKDRIAVKTAIAVPGHPMAP